MNFMEVNTGGLKKFVHSKSHKLKADPEIERGIDEGYRQYYKRKRKERIRNWIIAIVIALMILGWLLFR